MNEQELRDARRRRWDREVQRIRESDCPRCEQVRDRYPQTEVTTVRTRTGVRVPLRIRLRAWWWWWWWYRRKAPALYAAHAIALDRAILGIEDPPIEGFHSDPS